MPQATFWFSSPFRAWIGQRTLTWSWEGETTLREIFLELRNRYPSLAAALPQRTLSQATIDEIAAVILDGDFLSLDSRIPDGARVDVLTPLTGGCPRARDTCESLRPAVRAGDRHELRPPENR